MKFLKSLFQKRYTHDEVAELMFKTIRATSHATIEWVQMETIIVDCTTKEEIPNSEITLNENRESIINYVKEHLKDEGITLTSKN